MVAGNAIRLTEEMRGLQVKMRRAIKEAVETVRGRLSAIKENSAGSLRDLELEVKALVRGVLQVLDPLVSHVQEYADDVRRVSEAVRGSLDGEWRDPLPRSGRPWRLLKVEALGGPSERFERQLTVGNPENSLLLVRRTIKGSMWQ